MNDSFPATELHHSEADYDEAALFAEIDAFGEEVRKRAERLGLK